MAIKEHRMKTREHKMKTTEHRMRTTDYLNMHLVINGFRWYTYKQLARKLRVTPQTIFNRANTGRIERINVDGATFYREKDAE